MSREWVSPQLRLYQQEWRSPWQPKYWREINYQIRADRRNKYLLGWRPIEELGPDAIPQVWHNHATAIQRRWRGVKSRQITTPMLRQQRLLSAAFGPRRARLNKAAAKKKLFLKRMWQQAYKDTS